MALKIMVVDDSPTVVKFVSFSLKKRGYEVVAACDGMDAIENSERTCIIVVEIEELTGVVMIGIVVDS